MYSEEEAVNILKAKAKRELKRRGITPGIIWPILGIVGVIILVAIISIHTYDPDDIEPTATPYVVTATPTATPQPTGWQANVAGDGPTQVLMLSANVDLIGRIGYALHDGHNWVHYPVCIQVVACEWPMLPPNDSYMIWVEYNGTMLFIEAEATEFVVYRDLGWFSVEQLP